MTQENEQALNQTELVELNNLLIEEDIKKFEKIFAIKETKELIQAIQISFMVEGITYNKLIKQATEKVRIIAQKNKIFFSELCREHLKEIIDKLINFLPNEQANVQECFFKYILGKNVKYKKFDNLKELESEIKNNLKYLNINLKNPILKEKVKETKYF